MLCRYRNQLHDIVEFHMDTNKITSWFDQAQPILLAFGLKVLGAIAVFIIGRWLIGLVCRMIGAAMTRQKLDITVQNYLVSFISVALNIVLVVAILGYFGVETTSFAALVAGAGVAIGAAWNGLLGNFAAGIFLQILRPYCHTDHDWQVYFDTNKTIADTLGAAGFPVATRPVKVYPV
jgi:small conductance mechanosensitive channel